MTIRQLLQETLFRKSEMLIELTQMVEYQYDRGKEESDECHELEREIDLANSNIKLLQFLLSEKTID